MVAVRAGWKLYAVAGAAVAAEVTACGASMAVDLQMGMGRAGFCIHDRVERLMFRARYAAGARVCARDGGRCRLPASLGVTWCR